MAETGKIGRRGRARHDAVLKAAARLFLERGFEHTTLDMVIEEAGGSRRTIYDQFGNKEGLFAAVIRGRSALILAPLDDLAAEGQTPEETLTAFGRSLLRNLLSPEILGVLRLVIAESPRFPDLGDAYYQAGPAAARRTLARYFRRQVEAGSLRLTDTDAAAGQFLGLVLANQHIRAMIYPDQLPTARQINAQVRQAVAVFLHGAADAPPIRGRGRRRGA